MQLKPIILLFILSALAVVETYAFPTGPLHPYFTDSLTHSNIDSAKSKARAARDSGTMVITLQHAGDIQSRIDSVYLIMDQADLRGAGIVKQIYYPVNNQVTLTVRKGRYYASIYCLGKYNRASFSRELTVKPARARQVKLRLQVVSLYTQGQAQMPKEKWDPAHLAIMEQKR